MQDLLDRCRGSRRYRSSTAESRQSHVEPGGQLTPIYDALARTPAIRHYLARHEQAAGFMADVAAALATLGLGAGQVRTEIFGARPGLTPGIAAAAAVPPHQPPGPPGAGPEVA